MSTETPCPNCAYDLRGHDNVTRCPECGEQVAVGPAIAQTVRWIDIRLLDLWSIFVLELSGIVVAVVTVMAMRHGYYAALILGMMSMVTISAATVWFLALTPGIFLRYRKPFVQRVSRGRMSHIMRWWIINAILATLPVMVFVFG